MAAAVALPVLYLFLRAAGTGLDEISDFVFRGRTLAIVTRSVVLVAVVTATSLALALPLAWLTVRTDLPFRRVWAVLTVLPLAVPSYVMAFLFVAALGPRGHLQQLLEGPLGIERLPSLYGLFGAAFVIAIISYPYALLTLRAAFRGLDPAIEETSRMLGVGSWLTFLRVTLPQLRPALATGGLLVALYALSDFGAVSLLRYETFTWAIYVQYQSSFDRALAAALALLLLGIATALFAGEALARGRGATPPAAPNARRGQRLVPLGGWKWPALMLCSGVVSITLLAPGGVLGYWLVRGILSGETIRVVWSSLFNSAAVSAMAAGVTAIAAIPVSIFAVRYRSWASELLERVASLGFALPGIVVALALVFFAANYARLIYQTTSLLVFSYVVLFLPLALGPLRSSLLQVSPRIEEAARSLGRGPAAVVRTVTLPLVRSGLVAGAALVFLAAMKELPATLLLSPLGFKTLATSIWAASSEAFFARAAAPALMLILLSSVPMALLLARDGDRRGP